ncbi:MAG: hypothetical protein KY464_04160 [Gemmatimonadetes bacterium]|nr:hypothetical protein [Gemmatimonadota bacterium]
MADIRLAQPRANRLWLYVGVLAALGFILWASAFVVGDATNPAEAPKVGAQMDFGEERTPVLPAQATPFQSMESLQTRDLGRLIRLTGAVESRVAGNAVWVRSPGGRRILVRFEPPPSPEALRRIGGSIEVDGYLEKISEAEFEVWMDTLGVRIPRPPPGRKFGDLPEASFARVDSLFIKNFYISVRPEALEPRPREEPAEASK